MIASATPDLNVEHLMCICNIKF